MPTPLRLRRLPRTLCISLPRVAALLALLLATGPSALRAADEPADNEPAPKEGRLTNIASVPFRFRLHRASGASYTEEFTLAPGKSLVIRVPQPGVKSDLEGITGDGKGHVKIEYPELGGVIRLQLPARTRDGRLVPTWFHVKDSNGFSRLIQASTVEEAKAAQADLQKKPRLTPEHLESIKEMLRANWVLFDR